MSLIKTGIIVFLVYYCAGLLYSDNISLIRSSDSITDFEINAMHSRKANMIKWLPLSESTEFYTISPSQVVEMQKERFKEGKFLKYLSIKWRNDIPLIDIGVPLSAGARLSSIDEKAIKALMAEYVTGFHKKICAVKRTGYMLEVPDFCIMISRKLPDKLIYNVMKEIIDAGSKCEELYKHKLKLKNRLVGIQTLKNVMADYPQFRNGLKKAIKERRKLSASSLRKLRKEIKKCEAEEKRLLKHQQKLIRFLESPFGPDYFTMMLWKSVTNFAFTSGH